MSNDFFFFFNCILFDLFWLEMPFVDPIYCCSLQSDRLPNCLEGLQPKEPKSELILRNPYN